MEWAWMRVKESEKEKNIGENIIPIYTEKPFILCRGTLGQAVWRSRHYIVIYMYTTYNTFLSQTLCIYINTLVSHLSRACIYV